MIEKQPDGTFRPKLVDLGLMTSSYLVLPIHSHLARV